MPKRFARWRGVSRTSTNRAPASILREMTQTQIAERLGISQMHVSRLLAGSLAALRE
jgi:DNA-binding Xre family transcriptional regulator